MNILAMADGECLSLCFENHIAHLLPDSLSLKVEEARLLFSILFLSCHQAAENIIDIVFSKLTIIENRTLREACLRFIAELCVLGEQCVSDKNVSQNWSWNNLLSGILLSNITSGRIYGIRQTLKVLSNFPVEYLSNDEKLFCTAALLSSVKVLCQKESLEYMSLEESENILTDCFLELKRVVFVDRNGEAGDLEAVKVLNLLLHEKQILATLGKVTSLTFKEAFASFLKVCFIEVCFSYVKLESGAIECLPKTIFAELSALLFKEAFGLNEVAFLESVSYVIKETAVMKKSLMASRAENGGDHISLNLLFGKLKSFKWDEILLSLTDNLKYFIRAKMLKKGFSMEHLFLISSSFISLQQGYADYADVSETDPVMLNSQNCVDDFFDCALDIERCMRLLSTHCVVDFSQAGTLRSYVEFMKSFWCSSVLMEKNSTMDFSNMISFVLGEFYSIGNSWEEIAVRDEFVKSGLFYWNPEQFALFLKYIRISLSENSNFGGCDAKKKRCMVALRCLNFVLEGKGSSWKRRVLKNTLVPFSLRLSVILQQVKQGSVDEQILKDVIVPCMRCLQEIVKSESLQMSSREAGLLLESVSLCTLYRAPSLEEFGLFLSVVSCFQKILFSLARRHFDNILDNFSIFLGCVRNVLVTISFHLKMFRFGNLESEVQSELKLCVESMARLLEEISSNKKSVSKYVPYILSDCVHNFHNFSFIEQYKEAIMSGVYCLIDCCSEHELGLMFSSLDSAGKDTFRSIHADYKKFHEYKGKV